MRINVKKRHVKRMKKNNRIEIQKVKSLTSTQAIDVLIEDEEQNQKQERKKEKERNKERERKLKKMPNEGVAKLLEFT